MPKNYYIQDIQLITSYMFMVDLVSVLLCS